MQIIGLTELETTIVKRTANGESKSSIARDLNLPLWRVMAEDGEAMDKLQNMIHKNKTGVMDWVRACLFIFLTLTGGMASLVTDDDLARLARRWRREHVGYLA